MSELAMLDDIGIFVLCASLLILLLLGMDEPANKSAEPATVNKVSD